MIIKAQASALFIVAGLLLAACGGQPESSTTGEAAAEPAGEDVANDVSQTSESTANDVPADAGACTDPFRDADIRFSPDQWPDTDFCQTTIDYNEVLGLLPPDRIKPIYEPEFASIADADDRIADQEPVVVFVEGDEARAYPLAIMTWHEIVNDEVGGRPVAVTFCPLCNAAIVFDRTVDGQVHTFGTSGNLRNSDLIMWDHETHSWWQQFTGGAIVGEMTGVQLDFLPSHLASWAEFKAAYPDGVALLPLSGYPVRYGTNPYEGYDTDPSLGGDGSPFAYQGIVDRRLLSVERVLGVVAGGEAVAYPFTALAEAGVIEDTVGGQPVVVFHQPGQVSALDAAIIELSTEVGSAAAYNSTVDGETLTFAYNDGVIIDTQTGSQWNIFGQATSGPMEGTQLDQILAYPHFWFAWAAFQPETTVWGEETS